MRFHYLLLFFSSLSFCLLSTLGLAQDKSRSVLPPIEKLHCTSPFYSLPHGLLTNHGLYELPKGNIYSGLYVDYNILQLPNKFAFLENGHGLMSVSLNNSLITCPSFTTKNEGLQVRPIVCDSEFKIINAYPCGKGRFVGLGCLSNNNLVQFAFILTVIPKPSIIIFNPEGSSFNLTACSSKADRVIAVDKDSHVYIWKASTGEFINTFDSKLPYSWRSMEISPSGELLAVTLFELSECRNVYLYNVNDGRLLHTFKQQPLTATAMTFSPDSTKIAITDNSQALSIWSTKNGSRVGGSQKTDHRVFSISFVDSGRKILTLDHENGINGPEFKRTCTLWNASTLAPIRTFEVKQEYRNVDSGTLRRKCILCASLDNNESHLLIATISFYAGLEVHTFDIQSGKRLHTLQLDRIRDVMLFEAHSPKTVFPTDCSYTTVRPTGKLVSVSRNPETHDIRTQ